MGVESGTIRTVMTSHPIADVFRYTLRATLVLKITQEQFERLKQKRGLLF